MNYIHQAYIFSFSLSLVLDIAKWMLFNYNKFKSHRRVLIKSSWTLPPHSTAKSDPHHPKSNLLLVQYIQSFIYAHSHTYKHIYIYTLISLCYRNYGNILTSIFFWGFLSRTYDDLSLSIHIGQCKYFSITMYYSTLCPFF